MYRIILIKREREKKVAGDLSRSFRTDNVGELHPLMGMEYTHRMIPIIRRATMRKNNNNKRNPVSENGK